MYNRELAVKQRKALKLTQEQLAHKSGVSSQLISKYERGKVTPNRTNQAKLEQALELDPGTLWTKESAKLPHTA
jgi:transcriptional regulator with XRE-family HTH domain